MIILDEYCWRTATPHTGGWSCPECVAEHIASFFEALAEWAPSRQVKRADWVTCPGFEHIIGVVSRVAKNGVWADVKWPTGTKRMLTQHLEVQTTIAFGDGWTVTDVTRERELGQERASPCF